MAIRGNYNESPFVFSQDQLSFDATAFDNFIEAHGIEFKHWKAVPCPGSDSDRGSPRSTHLNHTCSNGFYFRGGRCFLGVFENTNTKKFLNVEGIIDSSIMTLHAPRFYKESGCQILFGVNDRLDLADDTIVVPKLETMVCSPTGIDRPMFPIVKMDHVIDAFGKEYAEGSDFSIVNGNIHWIGQNRPQFVQGTGDGGIYSIRYLYRPSWYVNLVLHEVRLVNTFDPTTGVKSQVRYPQLLIVQREIYYLNQLHNSQEDTSREGLAPRSGMNLTLK